MAFLLRHLELYLTVLGLLVILSAGFLLQEQTLGPWRVTALVAIAVGAIHGCLFWGVRQRQRMVRDDTIHAVQSMLRDVVNNQLLVIQMADSMNRRQPGSVAQKTVDHSVAAISDALESLSRESLRAWSSRYDPVNDVNVPEPTEEEQTADTGLQSPPSSGVVSGRGRPSHPEIAAPLSSGKIALKSKA
jgi:hypothetical protein